MDLWKGVKKALRGGFSRKELGYPAGTWVMWGGRWVPYDDNFETYIEKAYKALPSVYSVVSFILQKSASAPHEIYKVKNERKAQKYKAMMANATSTTDIAKAMIVKAQAFDLVEGTELEKLLNNPNPIHTTTELYENIDGYLLLTGNSYCYAATSGFDDSPDAKPVELWPVPSPAVTPIAGGPQDPVKGYKVNYSDQGEVPASKMMHEKYFNPQATYNDPTFMLIGMSPLRCANILTSKARAADIAQGTMFANMAPAGIISGDGETTEFSDQQKSEMRDTFRRDHTGIYNAGGIYVTPSKLTWEQIGLSPVDLEIIAGKREILQEICNIYHVPAVLLDTSKSTYNNVSEARKAFMTDAVMPVINRRRDSLNKWLGPKFGNQYFIDYDLTVFPEMQEDLETQSKAAGAMYWISLNEKRAITGYDQDPDPNMDKKYIPRTLVSLEDVAQPLDIDTELLDQNNIDDYDREAQNETT